MASLYFVALQLINAAVAVGLYILLQKWLAYRKAVAARRNQDARRKDSPPRRAGSQTGLRPDVFVPEPSMLELPQLPSDWAIRPEQIEITRRPSGALWELGTGAFGKVVEGPCTGFLPGFDQCLSIFCLHRFTEGSWTEYRQWQSKSCWSTAFTRNRSLQTRYPFCGHVAMKTLSAS